jgi:hypothetical protein
MSEKEVVCQTDEFGVEKETENGHVYFNLFIGSCEYPCDDEKDAMRRYYELAMRAMDGEEEKGKPDYHITYINKEELDKLAVLFATNMYENPTEEDVTVTREELESAFIGKFTDYITSGPGYRGPVYFIVWDGGPNCFDVVTVDTAGAMRLEKRETA